MFRSGESPGRFDYLYLRPSSGKKQRDDNKHFHEHFDNDNVYHDNVCNDNVLVLVLIRSVCTSLSKYHLMSNCLYSAGSN